MAATDTEPYIYNVYADESGTRGCDYMVIGSLSLPQKWESLLRADLAAVRKAHSMHAEFKWTKVSRAKLDAYKDFISCVSKRVWASYCCIVVDMDEVDHKTYSGNDRELSFYKFYYLLLSRKLVKDCAYHIYTDDLITRKKNRLKTLEDCCNNWFLKAKGADLPKPIRSLQPVNSKDDDLIQVVDILTGAVGFECNGGSSQAKRDIVDCLKATHRVGSFKWGTPRRCENFDVWAWRPKENAP